MSKDTDALELAETATDRLFEAHGWFDGLDREQVYVGVARWTGRNGVCKYDKRLDQKRFGERMSELPRESGSCVLVINELILEDGNRDGFIDTVQHELAHAVCREKYDDYPRSLDSHGPEWKEVARRLGADDSACHHRRDRSDEIKYYTGCPSCGQTYGRTKRSKIIKRAFDYSCGNCDEHGLVSFDVGEKMPDENGTIAVKSLSWDDRKEWVQMGKP